MLVEKLKIYGVNENSLLWFKDFLSGRGQYTAIGAAKSLILEIKHGVFQGSLSGPLLFIIFVNDIATIEDINGIIKICIYADDTTISVKLGDNDIENQLLFDRILEELNTYMALNSLKMNVARLSCW